MDGSLGMSSGLVVLGSKGGKEFFWCWSCAWGNMGIGDGGGQALVFGMLLGVWCFLSDGCIVKGGKEFFRCCSNGWGNMCIGDGGEQALVFDMLLGVYCFLSG